MPAFVRRLHARFRAIPLRLRRALLLPFALALPLALAGCEPGTATDSATESDGATSSATSGSAGETTGETTGETAAVDCEEFSTAVPGLTWTATHDGARTELVALPGGHAVHLTDAHTVARTGPDGVVWSKTFDEWVSQLAPLPGDRIAVAGISTADTMWLAILSADGELLESATPPPPDDLSPPSVEELAADPSGAIYALTVEGPAPLVRRIARFDDALAPTGGFAIDNDLIGIYSALAADDDGNAYVATLHPVTTSTWRLDVLSYAGDGALRWLSDGVSYDTSTLSGIEPPEVSVGDQVYALAGTNSAFALQALTHDGAVAWTKVRSFAEVPTDPEVADHWLHAVVASPCGGAYLGGRTDVDLDGVSERASALHVDPGGSFGEASHFLDTYEGLTYRETTSIALAADGRLATLGRFEPTIPDDLIVWWVGGL